MSQPNFEASPGQGMPVAMQQPAAPVVRKQALNVYTVMLIVTFLCMLIASILFYMELSKFDSWWDTDEATISWLGNSVTSAQHALASLKFWS